MIEIPGYRILRQLGHGGMATVYLAIQQSVDREVALKVMSEYLLTDPNFGERFLREARIAAKLRHRHVVGVHDVAKNGNVHYIAMEYLAGGPLLRKDGRAREISFALRVTREISQALAYAHAKGFIHRDVKPDNILMRDDGSSALTDFGIARAADSATRMTRTGAVIGTPHYMSPEQARGKPVDGRADLYSLGVVLYEVLVGRVPFHAEDSLAVGIMHITEPPPPLPEHLSALQPMLDVMLAKKPEDRYQTGDEMAQAIREYEIAIANGQLPSLMLPTREQREAILSQLPAIHTPQPMGWARDHESELAPAMGQSAMAQRESLRATQFPGGGEPPRDPAREVAADARDERIVEQRLEPAPPRRVENVEAISAGRQRAEPRLGAVDTIVPGAPRRPDRRRDEATGSRRWIALLVSLVVLGAIGVGLWFYQDKLRALLPDTELNALLVQADKARDEGQLTGSGGVSALELYRAVLRQDPDNAPAIAGVREVGNRLAQQARESIARKDLARARQELAAARDVLQGGVVIDEVDAALRAAETQGTALDDLLAQALAARDAGKLTGGDDSASALFQRALAADPGNAIAARGLDDIAQALADRAAAAIAAKKYDDAESLIAEIDRVRSGHASIPTLRASLGDGRKQAAQAIETLIARGEEQLRRGDISAPPGANAEESFRRALAAAPGEPRARAGLARVGSALLVRAEAAIEGDDLAGAEALLKRAEGAGAPAGEIAQTRSRVRELRERREIASERDTVTPEQQARIDRYLADADAALASGALNEPPGGNAFDLYRAALALDRGNARAKAGLAALPVKARELFDAALASNRPNAAAGFLDAFRSTSADSAAKAELATRLGRAYVEQARRQLGQGQAAQAKKSLERARSVAPDDPGIAEVAAQIPAGT